MSTRPDGAPLPQAVLLDASDAGLVMAGRLDAHGVPVTVLAQQHYAWVARTRHATCRMMPGLDDRETWLAVLHELARDGPGVLIPISDRACAFLVDEREAIPPDLVSFEHARSAHAPLMAKSTMYALAADAGLRTPAVRRVATTAELTAVAQDGAFPALTKPVLSHVYRQRFGDWRVRRVDTPEELLAAAGPAVAAGLEMLVTEHVPGSERRLEGAVTVRLADGSYPLAYTRRKLRQYPPYFGAGSVLEVVPSDEVLAFARRLLDHVGFVGVSSLEAKRHTETGELVLMEINVRVPQNIGLGEAAGVDASWRIYAALAGRALPPQPPPRSGAKTVVASLEVPAAVTYVRAGDLSVRRLLGSYRGVRTISGLGPTDPGPLLAFAGEQLLRARRYVSRGGTVRR